MRPFGKAVGRRLVYRHENLGPTIRTAFSKVLERQIGFMPACRVTSDTPHRFNHGLVRQLKAVVNP